VPDNETIRKQALDWAVRVGDPEFEGWDEFTVWLDADPRHARAYDEVTGAIADVTARFAELPSTANDLASKGFAERAGQLTRRRWLGIAITACVGAVLMVGYWQGLSGRYSVVTVPGDTRRIALEDGSSIFLSGGTRLILDHDDPRFARLDSGQALFSVRHDAAHPFAVLAGGDRLVDAGTVFDVTFDKQNLKVEVAEGLVIFNPGKQAATIRPGEKLAARAGSSAFRIAPVDASLVGEWRSGRATFDAAPIEEIASQLSRLSGVDYIVEGKGDTFTGSIIIAPLKEDPAALGPLLGVQVHKRGASWVITAR